MTSGLAISVSDVHKRYRRYTAGVRTLKDRAVTFLRGTEEENYVQFEALRGVTFEVPKGQMVAVVGQNGAGKSTLLRILAKIVRPDAGEVHVAGRVTPILDLAGGFSPELSGRKNVYLYGLMLGMSSRDISDRLPRIIEFSELADFIDTPIKHYSSGMLVRLGFAVVAHMEPDVLLVDEVLAVGDASYQTRCLARIEQFRSEGRTILVVTHTLERYVSMCDRALLLSHGELVEDGKPEAVLGVYQGMTG